MTFATFSGYRKHLLSKHTLQRHQPRERAVDEVTVSDAADTLDDDHADIIPGSDEEEVANDSDDISDKAAFHLPFIKL